MNEICGNLYDDIRLVKTFAKIQMWKKKERIEEFRESQINKQQQEYC